MDETSMKNRPHAPGGKNGEPPHPKNVDVSKTRLSDTSATDPKVIPKPPFGGIQVLCGYPQSCSLLVSKDYSMSCKTLQFKQRQTKNFCQTEGPVVFGRQEACWLLHSAGVHPGSLGAGKSSSDSWVHETCAKSQGEVIETSLTVNR